MIQARKKPGKPISYEPTPEEIREACLDLQDEWSPEEEFRRRVFKGMHDVYIKRAPELGPMKD